MNSKHHQFNASSFIQPLGHEPLRIHLETIYQATLDDNDYFECQQNLFGFFKLLVEIDQQAIQE